MATSFPFLLSVRMAESWLEGLASITRKEGGALFNFSFSPLFFLVIKRSLKILVTFGSLVFIF